MWRLALYANLNRFFAKKREPDPADDDVWDDVMLVVSEAVAVGGMRVLCGGGWIGRVLVAVRLVWGVLGVEMGWRGCGFISAVCQVVEELGEVEEG